MKLKALSVKSTEHVNQLWFGYFNETRLRKKWGIWSDAHVRIKEDFVDNFLQCIVRVGLIYLLTAVSHF